MLKRIFLIVLAGLVAYLLFSNREAFNVLVTLSLFNLSIQMVAGMWFLIFLLTGAVLAFLFDWRTILKTRRQVRTRDEELRRLRERIDELSNHHAEETMEFGDEHRGKDSPPRASGQ